MSIRSAGSARSRARNGSCRAARSTGETRSGPPNCRSCRAIAADPECVYQNRRDLFDRRTNASTTQWLTLWLRWKSSRRTVRDWTERLPLAHLVFLRPLVYPASHEPDRDSSPYWRRHRGLGAVATLWLASYTRRRPDRTSFR